MCINSLKIHIKVIAMRTNIVIDDSLMHDALKATGLKTKKEAVELGLKVLIKLNQQETIKAFRGKLKWEDSAEEVKLNQ
jgi:Arc/MetJ family transcription regulator